MLTGLIYALLAGLFGALASSSAKLSLGASYLKELCDSAVRKWTVEEDSLTSGVDITACEWVKMPSFFYYLFQCIKRSSASGMEHKRGSFSIPIHLSII